VIGIRPGSSGVTRRSAGSVSVTAGTDPIDQRLTLLHELAHWLREHDRSRFLLTAPPLRLPGIVGSPLTPVATV